MEPPTTEVSYNNSLLDENTNLKYVVAGLLSTITWNPYLFHPEVMLGFSEKVLALVEEFQGHPITYGVPEKH
jgi:hypothetical protein